MNDCAIRAAPPAHSPVLSSPYEQLLPALFNTTSVMRTPGKLKDPVSLITLGAPICVCVHVLRNLTSGHRWRIHNRLDYGGLVLIGASRPNCCDQVHTNLTGRLLLLEEATSRVTLSGKMASQINESQMIWKVTRSFSQI